MTKLTIPAILAATVLVAGIFAFIPVEQASTIHTSPSQSSTSVLVLDKTLPLAGTVVDYTYTAISDSIIIEVMMDNADTVGNDGSYVICQITVGGNNYRNIDNFGGDGDGNFCDADANPDGIQMDNNDNFEKRTLFGFLNNQFSNDMTEIPVQEGDTVVFRFNTENGNNDVELELALAVRGDGTFQ